MLFKEAHDQNVMDANAQNAALDAKLTSTAQGLQRGITMVKAGAEKQLTDASAALSGASQRGLAQATKERQALAQSVKDAAAVSAAAARKEGADLQAKVSAAMEANKKAADVALGSLALADKQLDTRLSTMGKGMDGGFAELRQKLATADKLLATTAQTAKANTKAANAASMSANSVDKKLDGAPRLRRFCSRHTSPAHALPAHEPRTRSRRKRWILIHNDSGF